MGDRGHTRLTLEVEETEPLAGRLLDERGRGRSFTGWLGLAAALGSELPGRRNPESQGSATVPARPDRRLAGLASVALLALEVLGTILMWLPIPLAWLWVGGRIYSVTGSLAADLAVAFFGFVATTLLVLVALIRVDKMWIALRRRAGHKQAQGAVAQVAIVSGTVGIAGFLLWYYLLAKAFILPFMPSH
jgi:hypothetical protein